MKGESEGQQPDALQAIMALRRVAGPAGQVAPAAARIELAEALSTVAESQPDQITPAAKLNILGQLIKAGKPGFKEHRDLYHALATSIATAKRAEAPELSSETVLEDLHSVVAGAAKFEETNSGQALPHHVTAFFMEDVCDTATVNVEGIDATWIFSEFETTAPFEDVAEWVDPNNWHKRSPTMFKGMEPVNGVTHIKGPAGVTQWHGLFLETVQLVDELKTQLWCDFYKMDDTFAGMTYSLAKSVDKQIDVDRGFLLVNNLGGSRHVKALKIVSFTEDVWDYVALQVCGMWTDFVKAAVEKGEKSDKLPGPEPGTVTSAIDQWASFATDSAQEYVGQSTSWARRVASGSYRSEDMVRDGARFWLQAYRDMLKAGALGDSILQQLAGGPRAPGQVIPLGVTTSAAGTIQPGSEGTTQPTPSLGPGGRLETTDLKRIGYPQAVIPAKSVKARPVKLAGDMSGVHIEADVSTARQGLYIGDVMDAQGNRAPVQLYVSRAVQRAGP